MKVELLKNAFKPGVAGRARQLLKRGEIADVDDAAAKILIDRGYAAKFEPKAKADSPKAEKKSKKAASVDAE